MKLAYPLVLAPLVGLASCESPSPVHRERIVVEDRPAAAPGSAARSDPATAAGLREVFPHVRVDIAAGKVEFDGVVPVDAHDPQAPHVYLELIACTPDTREHESLIMTRARAAHVHAALLMLGLEPGAPGDIRISDAGPVLTPPHGSPLQVTFRWTDAAGATRTASPADWIISARSRSKPEMAANSFVFAGSRMRGHGGGGTPPSYDADGSGTLIGLATFATETIALRHVFSHDSSITDPEWIADAAHVPPAGTAVTVILTSAANNRP